MGRDVSDSIPDALKFEKTKHILYILDSFISEETVEKLVVEHIHLGNLFWGLAALDILLHAPNLFLELSLQWPSLTAQASKPLPWLTPWELRNELISVVRNSKRTSQGFAYGTGQDAHISSTMYALLSLLVLDSFDLVLPEALALASWISSLQLSDGSFAGDAWGEADARFVYCAIVSLSVLGCLDMINKESAVQWIQSCQNEDHAFGGVPGGESHSAYTFCCVASLRALGCLHDVVDTDGLAEWLAERQLPAPCGGFNGRPEKAPDVCYSWWIFASLVLLDRSHWVDIKLLKEFILSCQGSIGGIASCPGNAPDIFHTFFGTAALSLLDKDQEIKVCPVYTLSQNILKRSKLLGLAV